MTDTPGPLARVVTGYLRIIRFLAGSCMALIVAVMIAQVFFRYVLGGSLIWAEELCRYLLIWQTFLVLGLAYKPNVDDVRESPSFHLIEKLQGLGVVASSKNGKEVTYAPTEAGKAYVTRYREIRESCLIDALKADDALNHDIGQLARLLRVLSGIYDQAARSAASL